MTAEEIVTILNDSKPDYSKLHLALNIVKNRITYCRANKKNLYTDTLLRKVLRFK